MNTKNLVIRRFCNDDLEDFILLIRDKMSSPYKNYDEQFPTDEKSIEGILNYFINSDEFFAIEKEKRVIGYISLNYIDESTRNLGYCIHSAYQGRGYASEAVKMIKDYAKSNLKLAKLISGTAEENIPSMRLLKTMGFILINKSQGSFVIDENGNPIVFMGCSFECVL